jgi:peptide/nickel transport system substrate-binding protein
MDRAPFDDVRVRQAIRLAADRQALVDGALAGYARPGDDLFGSMTQYFAADLRRTQDVEQARSLLRAAGQSDLTITITTSTAIPGAVEATTLLAQQVKAAGITIKPKVVTPANYFTPAAGWPYPMGVDAQTTQASLTTAYRIALYSSGGETGWDYNGDRALQAAIAASDATQAAKLWPAPQQEQFDRGGHLVWANADYVDAVAKNVRGLTTTAVLYLNNFRFCDGWIARS